MRKLIHSVLVSTLLLAGAGATHAGDEFDEPPDTTVKGGARVVSWEPVILAFFAIQPSGSVEASNPTEVPAPPGLREGWHVLRPEVAPRDRALEPADPVYSGWRMDISGDDAGQGFDADVARAPGEKIVTFKRGEEAHLRLALDVLMELSEKERLDKVKTYFFLDERSVTLHRVSDDPKDIRAAASKDPIADSKRISDGRAAPFLVPDARKPDLLITYPLPTKGVFEVRYKARVRGRLSDDDVAQTKDVEGVIRFAVSDVALDLRVLNFDGTGGYRRPTKREKAQDAAKPQGGTQNPPPGGK